MSIRFALHGFNVTNLTGTLNVLNLTGIVRVEHEHQFDGVGHEISVRCMFPAAVLQSVLNEGLSLVHVADAFNQFVVASHIGVTHNNIAVMRGFK